MKTPFIFTILSMLVFIACKKENPTTKDMKQNILLTQWNTPFGVPPFDKIQSSDYLPAFKHALQQHTKEVKTIVANTAKPTFKNTVEALEVSLEEFFSEGFEN